MSEEIKAFYAKAPEMMAAMKEATPDVMAGFGGLFSKVMKDGAITLREKELIALGIAVADHCKPCIRAHVKKCLEAGATKEQILDAASVAVIMAGGPAYMHIPEVLDALEACGT